MYAFVFLVLFCFVLFLTDNSNDSLNPNNLDTKNMRRRGWVGIWTLNHLAQQPYY
jgi:hypothetical protein